MKQNGSWDSKSDPFGDFTIIFEAAKNNIKILNYPVRYYTFYHWLCWVYVVWMGILSHIIAEKWSITYMFLRWEIRSNKTGGRHNYVKLHNVSN